MFPNGFATTLYKSGQKKPDCPGDSPREACGCLARRIRGSIPDEPVKMPNETTAMPERPDVPDSPVHPPDHSADLATEDASDAPAGDSTTASHLEAARRRARGLFAAEVAHDRPYELVHAATAGRDAVVVVLLIWAILVAIEASEHAWTALVPAAIAMAIQTGISNAMAIIAQLRYWESELRRERDEIRTQPEFEREELRVLYAAKGFTGELLERVVDTICSDEERLLKVMLEEELGIFFEQRNHPVLTGLFTGAAALASGLLVALAAGQGDMLTTTVTATVVLAVLCLVRHGLNVRAGAESFARWMILTGVVAAIAYYLGAFFHGLAV